MHSHTRIQATAAFLPGHRPYRLPHARVLVEAPSRLFAQSGPGHFVGIGGDGGHHFGYRRGPKVAGMAEFRGFRQLPRMSATILAQQQLSLHLFIENELERTFRTSPVTGLEAAIESQETFLSKNGANHVEVSSIGHLPDGLIRFQLHPRPYHPNRIGHGISDHPGEKSGNERVGGRPGREAPAGLQTGLAARIGVEIRGATGKNAQQSRGETAKEARHAVGGQDLSGQGDGTRRRRRGLQSGFNDFQGIGEARGHGTGDTPRDETEQAIQKYEMELLLLQLLLQQQDNYNKKTTTTYLKASICRAVMVLLGLRRDGAAMVPRNRRRIHTTTTTR
jgi:hypothetical protein